MPDHKHITKKQGSHIRTTVTMRRGEVIALCRCWQTKKFPLCDGSHKFNQDDKGPVVIFTDCNVDFHEDSPD